MTVKIPHIIAPSVVLSLLAAPARPDPLFLLLLDCPPQVDRLTSLLPRHKSQAKSQCQLFHTALLFTIPQNKFKLNLAAMEGERKREPSNHDDLNFPGILTGRLSSCHWRINSIELCLQGTSSFLLRTGFHWKISEFMINSVYTLLECTIKFTYRCR